jgi:hypothetical protein
MPGHSETCLLVVDLHNRSENCVLMRGLALRIDDAEELLHSAEVDTRIISGAFHRVGFTGACLAVREHTDVVPTPHSGPLDIPLEEARYSSQSAKTNNARAAMLTSIVSVVKSRSSIEN